MIGLNWPTFILWWFAANSATYFYLIGEGEYKPTRTAMIVGCIVESILTVIALLEVA